MKSNIFTDLQSSLAEGYPELQIEYNRDKLKELGPQFCTSSSDGP